VSASDSETVTTNILYGVNYNGTDLWVAVGDLGTIIYSADGNDWTAATDSELIYDDILFDVVHDQSGIWVAVGNDGTVIYSSDGDDWTLVADSGTTHGLYAVTYHP